MEDLVREMLDTIELYKARADKVDVLDDGSLRHVLITPTACGSKLFLHIPLISFRQAPLQLEQKYGFTGLAGHYKMPEGLSPQDLQTYTQVIWHAGRRGDMSEEQVQQKLATVRERLEELNPSLRALKTDPEDKMGHYDVLLGTASEFNVRDMQFYLDGNSGTVARQNPAWKAMEEKIETRVPLYWVPSLETMQLIDVQMGQLLRPDRRIGWTPPGPGR